ncbi:MAG: hypothetical protein FWC23_08220 [Chitinispirillia bacterium]|nr:hypothetical protein [Chitinispirillia bacterium]MCL2269158.1 hypothetical protein [Chitinispirillia bacterium]
MKRVLKTAVFTFCFAIIAQAATVPVQNMTPLSLAGEYMHILNGHVALYDFDSSAIGSHFLRLHYAPGQWLRFSAGVGGSVSYAEPFIKGSRADISTTAGLGLYIPRLLNFMSLTGGYDGYYLKASEKQETHHRQVVSNEFGGTDTNYYIGNAKTGYTAAALHVPYAALVFHMGRFTDLEVGGLYYYFDLVRKIRTTTQNMPGEDGVMGSTISTNEIRDRLHDQARVFATLTLHERESGAYLTGGFSYAITNQFAEDKSRLNDFSFWAQIGIVMTEPSRGAVNRRGHKYDASYAHMIMRQERMAAQLNGDITRDSERMTGNLKRCKNHRHNEKGSCLVDKEGNYLPAKEGEGNMVIINPEE